jgi:hypothetical protein
MTRCDLLEGSFLKRVFVTTGKIHAELELAPGVKNPPGLKVSAWSPLKKLPFGTFIFN